MFSKILFILALLLITSCLNQQDDTKIRDEEKQIYSAIIDSLFDDSLTLIFIGDSSRSINRYIQKNLFSETLFGEEISAYYRNFFEKKNCLYNEELISELVEQNRKNFFFPGDYFAQINHQFVSYSAIYNYINGIRQKNNPLMRAEFERKKFGIVSFSKVAFNSEQTQALLEVNIYRIQKGEAFFCRMEKKQGKWHFAGNCYTYGPYKQ